MKKKKMNQKNTIRNIAEGDRIYRQMKAATLNAGSVHSLRPVLRVTSVANSC